MTLAGALARWHALAKPTRTAILALAGAAIVVLLLSSAFAHPMQTALFASPLQAEQLAEVQERLAGWNVSFTPTADNVVVNAKQRNELLLRLSLAGVPHAHVESSGDLLAKVGALTPQAVIDAQTRAGLAGDIQLGLRGIDGIDDARVIVAPAKPGYFADEPSHDASASVRVQLRPGAQLNRDAVAGIRAFVAASVPGLDAAHVTLVDDRGVALGTGAGGGDAGELQRSLQSALDAAFGASASIVRVRFEYDERSAQSREVRRVPIAAMPISSTTDDERYNGSGKNYDRTQAQIERGSETRETTISSQPGRVARISVAIFVDAARGIDLYKVRALAQASAGLDPRRGDAISVQAMDFARAPIAKKDGWWLAYGALVPLLPALALVTGGLIALRWCLNPAGDLLRSLAERANIARTAAAVSGAAPARVRGALQGEPPHAAAAIISALPAATAAAVLDMYPEHERSAIVRRMQRHHTPLLADAEGLVADA